MDAEIDRAHALYRLRSSVGWNAAKVADLLDVSPRTVGLWETNVQPMPEARWRLFVHEIAREFTRRRELVIVIAADGITPIDAVSDANFVDMTLDELAGVGVVTSLAVDRVSGQPRKHQQRFPIAHNQHVIGAAEKWKADIFSNSIRPDESMLAMHRWLTRKVLEEEARNPNLRLLKDKIAAANREVELAKNQPEQIREQKAIELELAVQELLHEVQRVKDQLSSENY